MGFEPTLRSMRRPLFESGTISLSDTSPGFKFYRKTTLRGKFADILPTFFLRTSATWASVRTLSKPSSNRRAAASCKPGRTYTKNGLDILSAELSSPYSITIVLRGLCLSYSKHLSTACWAHTLSCWLPVLHSNRFGILHFSLGSAFHTVCLHLFSSFLGIIWYER